MLQAIIDFLVRLFKTQEPPGVERPSSPSVWRNPHSLPYLDETGWRWRAHKEDLFIPFTEDPELAYNQVANTNSEDPLIDSEGRAEVLRPLDDFNHSILCDWIADQWVDSSGNLAALVVYKAEDGGLIVHRVKDISTDPYGRVWRYLGDNNAQIMDAIYARDLNIWAIVSGTKY